jgi:hypothetical protein
MVRGSSKTYGQLILEAQAKTGYQEVGETVQPLMQKLKAAIEDAAQQQYEQCMKKGFDLPKYYIHVFVVKDPLASQGMGAHNVLRIRRPHCRVSRPSPYQEEDHYLWSVTNYSNIKFEWCVPQRETMKYILDNPTKFDPGYVSMLRKLVSDKFEKLEDYVINEKVI